MFWIPNSATLRRAESNCAALLNVVVLRKSLVTQLARATTTSEIATM
jgi:hypothetical protein